MTEWIFLSPHFDDVALSAGALAWGLSQRGDKVEIWTLCAGDTPFDHPISEYAQMLHKFWELGEQDVPYSRSLEDAACCRVLGASFRRYTVPDCIYRYFPGSDQPVVKVPDDINLPLEPDEAHLIPPVTDFLRKNLPEECELVIPLAIGHHRDHVLTRLAAERLGQPVWHYVDYPYVIREQVDLKEFIPAGAEQFSVPLTAHAQQAWLEGIACHKSQIIMLWGDEAGMRREIENYAKSGSGGSLWKF